MKFFAVCAPGLEPILSQEFEQLGIQYSRPQGGSSEIQHTDEESGGIEFEGDYRTLFSANLNLRTCSRILLRLGEFNATSFAELRRKSAQLSWGNYLLPAQSISLRVTCRKSKLYHSDAVAERVAGSIGDSLGKSPIVQKDSSPNQSSTPQLILVRLLNDHCQISLDTSGDHLHRRGYRLATAKAPLRENLAAAMILASGWNGTQPFLDPFCGSGTLPIEAALIACKIPPGLHRRFAFQEWKNYDAKLWQSLIDKLPQPPSNLPPIQASDRDAGAIKIASANAERAGVLDKICFSHRAVSSILPPPDPGWLVTNPPYGIRVSSSHDLRNLYAQTGNVFRQICPGWGFAMLCNLEQLFGQTKLKTTSTYHFINGGLAVKLYCGMIPLKD